MVAEGLRLEVGFLWFQAFERDRREWQKGNASMRVPPGEKLKGSRSFDRRIMKGGNGRPGAQTPEPCIRFASSVDPASLGTLLVQHLSSMRASANDPKR